MTTRAEADKKANGNGLVQTGGDRSMHGQRVGLYTMKDDAIYRWQV
jgi:hypothetical protein